MPEPAVRTRSGGDQTREKILTVAERLFADNGFDGVSVRQVGAEAEVPFALVTYHFQTKAGLYKAVFARRGKAVSTRRREQLLAIKLGSESIENFAAIARALVEPLMRVREMEGGYDFARLLSREVNDPSESGRGIVKEYLDPIAMTAIRLLQEAAPSAPPAAAFWAFHFAIGAMAINHSDTGRIERLSGGLCTPKNLDELIDELTRFMASGFLGCLEPDKLGSLRPKRRPGCLPDQGEKPTPVLAKPGKR